MDFDPVVRFRRIQKASGPYIRTIYDERMKYDNELHARFCPDDSVDLESINRFPFIFRINDMNGTTGPTCLTILEKVCKERGWKEYGQEEEKMIGGNLLGWNLWWRSSPLHLSPYQRLYTWQHTNHIPKAFQFCSKSYLVSYCRTMRKNFGDVFDFSPDGFNLPSELSLLMDEHTKRSDTKLKDQVKNLWYENGEQKPIWIYKPVGKSQGKGIILLDELKSISYGNSAVAQEYLTQPMLIGGYKFDLRIYVCVASTHPLVVYAYKDGLARFATQKYNLEDLNNGYSHLTNASLNKLGPDYEKDKETVGPGCKWTFTRLREYFHSQGIEDWYLWQRIMSILILTILGEASKDTFPTSRNCFDFLGYDILIDKDLRPWLLEVNTSPGLGGDCDVDVNVKIPMLNQIFDILGFPCCEKLPIDPKNESKLEKERPSTGNIDLIQIECDKYHANERSKNGQAESNNENGEPKMKKSKSPGILKNKIESKKVEILTRPKTASGKLQNPFSETRHENTFKIYTQDLVKLYQGNILRAKKTQRKLSDHQMKLKRLEGEITTNFPSILPFRAFGGIKKKNWYEAPSKYGDWVRIFPFDTLSEKNSLPCSEDGLDLAAQAKNIQNYLEICRKLVRAYPKHDDEIYNMTVKKYCHLNTEIWIPPKFNKSKEPK